jgi:hypothetical protein
MKGALGLIVAAAVIYVFWLTGVAIYRTSKNYNQKRKEAKK